MSKLTDTAPERIFLLISDDEEHNAEPYPRGIDGGEITWCEEAALNCNVEYIRADLFERAEAERDALLKLLAEARDDGIDDAWITCEQGKAWVRKTDAALAAKGEGA
jgi:hypothetical protein